MIVLWSFSKTGPQHIKKNTNNENKIEFATGPGKFYKCFVVNIKICQSRTFDHPIIFKINI